MTFLTFMASRFSVARLLESGGQMHKRFMVLHRYILEEQCSQAVLQGLGLASESGELPIY